MPYFLTCLLVFLFAYTINLLYISVFYHRGLTHQSISLKPWLRSFVVLTGNWATGLDPKSWACMHRMHHLYSDTNEDPHSPVKYGVMGVLTAQLYSYRKTVAGLTLKKQKYMSVVTDLDFSVSWLNRSGLWFLPYLVHGLMALAIALIFQTWILAACYWLGIMSHPIQGWMVNALAHHWGYRNFDLPDNSRNNLPVAWLVFGEGYQNNHHQDPTAAKFSIKWWEVDPGYGLCQLLSSLRLIRMNYKHLGS